MPHVERPLFLFIDACDFVSYPVGGNLSFAKNMLKAFGNKLALVGLSTDGTPIGRWVEKDLNGVTYHFFSVGHRRSTNGKPLCPLGIRGYVDFVRHRNGILSLGVHNAFTGGGIALIGVSNWGWNSLCHRSPGLRDPGNASRYAYGRALGWVYFGWRTRAMARADIILAASDDAEIKIFIERVKGKLDPTRVVHFPTRVDTDLFRPEPKTDARARLGLPASRPMFVSCGRISRVKGWDFLLDAFCHLKQRLHDAMLVYVGDGEEMPALREQIRLQGVQQSVILAGFQYGCDLASYLNAGDVFVMGSRWEGWPTAMVEALACGKPVVSTCVSGTGQMVQEGVNGYLVKDRNPSAFADAMYQALELPLASDISLHIAERYALKNLVSELRRLWPAFVG